MADGRDFYIHHPDFLFITPESRTAIVVNRDDSVNLLDVVLITELQVAPPVAVSAVTESDSDG